jgi:hypothetical protein
MRLNFLQSIAGLMLLAIIAASGAAQNVRVEVGKRATAIPPVCV